MSSISGQFKSHLWRCCEVLPVMTGSDVTGRGPDRKYVLRMPDFFPRFFLTIAVVQVHLYHGYRKWRSSRDPFGVPLGVRMCNCCTISALVGPFHRKCPLGCSLGRPRLSFSSSGYLPLPRHFYFHIIFNNGFHLQCFRLKCLYCDMYILMNYLFNPYMSKEPIFVIFSEILTLLDSFL